MVYAAVGQSVPSYKYSKKSSTSNQEGYTGRVIAANPYPIADETVSETAALPLAMSEAKKTVRLTMQPPKEIWESNPLDLPLDVARIKGNVHITLKSEFVGMVVGIEYGDSQPDTWHIRLNDAWVEIDPDQLWFWTPEWQAKQREAEEDIKAGRYKSFDSMDDMLADLLNE